MFGKQPISRSRVVRPVRSQSAFSRGRQRALQLVKGKHDYVEEVAIYSDSRLEKLTERRRSLIAALVGGLVTTLIVWIAALSFPSATAAIYSYGFNSDFSSLITVLLMLIPFAPPFVSVFALSNLLFPSAPDANIAIGVMSTFDYREKSNRRVVIFLTAGFAGGLNCLLMLIAVSNATGH